MIKAVIDTNLFLSGLLNATGAPAKLILYWLEGQFEVLISDQTMDEYTFVLRHSPGVEQSKVSELLDALHASGLDVIITDTLKVCKDSDDDKFLETAVAGHADFLVMKNTKHFPYKSYQEVRIVKISKFLKELEKQLQS